MHADETFAHLKKNQANSHLQLGSPLITSLPVWGIGVLIDSDMQIYIGDWLY